MAGELPSQGLTAGHVFNYRQIRQAMIERQVSDVSAKSLAWYCLLEFTIQDVVASAMFLGFLHDGLVGIDLPDFGE